MIVRNEKETDHRHVEELIRKAFYNLYVPGCTEHLSGAGHARPRGLYSGAGPGAGTGRPGDRQHSVHKGEAFRRGGEGKRDPHVRPVCIAPEYQRMGYGRRLMETSFEKAAALGYDVIVIFGSPANYVARGFKSCKKLNVCADNGRYPAAMLVKELVPGALDGRKWVYRDSL